MSVKIIKKEEQASGSFTSGAILENKPIGFPQDGGEQKPYSNLFYWANAWSDNGGLIGEHPHKMFEIVSFLIDGEVQHYDSKMNGWLSLKKGDAQIIRSGSGITHAERIMKGSRVFQVWFDPNIKESMHKEASYDDYRSEEMKYYEENGISYKDYMGNRGPLKMDSEGVLISELSIPIGKHKIELDNSKIYSYYLLDGKASIAEKGVVENDFIIVESEDGIEIEVSEDTRLFSITVPQQLTYKTYLELVNN